MPKAEAVLAPSKSRGRSKCAAIHEAGHAVIGRVLGLTCGQVTIVPDVTEGTAGHSITHDPWETLHHWENHRGKYRGDPMKSILTGRLLMLMAGVEAERVILGRSRGGDGYDRYDITTIVNDQFEAETFWKKTEPRLRKHTHTLVRRHRAKIERVAAELMKEGALSPDEIDALVYREMRKPPVWGPDELLKRNVAEVLRTRPHLNPEQVEQQVEQTLAKRSKKRR